MQFQEDDSHLCQVYGAHGSSMWHHDRAVIWHRGIKQERKGQSRAEAQADTEGHIDRLKDGYLYD